MAPCPSARQSRAKPSRQPMRVLSLRRPRQSKGATPRDVPPPAVFSLLLRGPLVLPEDGHTS
eukprot:10219928-Alexandrium_andersonii.AAC.1